MESLAASCLGAPGWMAAARKRGPLGAPPFLARAAHPVAANLGQGVNAGLADAGALMAALDDAARRLHQGVFTRCGGGDSPASGSPLRPLHAALAAYAAAQVGRGGRPVLTIGASWWAPHAATPSADWLLRLAAGETCVTASKNSAAVARCGVAGAVPVSGGGEGPPPAQHVVHVLGGLVRVACGGAGLRHPKARFT